MTSSRGARPPETGQAARRPARVIGTAILVATIVGTGLSLTIALIAVRLAEAGFSARAIGVNTAAGGIATLVSAPLIPRLARRIGVATLLMASLLVGAAALVGFTLTAGYTPWLLLRFLVGAAVTVMFVLSEFWITTAAPAGRGGLAIAVYVTSLAAGFAVGPLLLGFVGAGGNLPFYLGAALFVGPALPLAFEAGAAPRLETRSAKSVLAYLREAPAPTLAALLHGAIEVAGLSLLPVFGLRAGLAPSQGALLASLFILGNCVLQLPIGALADRMDRSRLLVAIALAGLVGAVLLGVLGTRRLIAFEVLLLVWGGIVGALYPVGLGRLGMLYRGADLAGANAAYVMCYAAGMLVGPPVIGAGLDAMPPAGFFVATAALIALYLAVALPAALRAGSTR